MRNSSDQYNRFTKTRSTTPDANIMETVEREFLLIEAAKSNNPRTVSRLLAAIAEYQKDADGPETERVNSVKCIALSWAARNGHVDIVALLVHAGTALETPYSVIEEGEPALTPLAWAARYGHVEVFELLLAAGANLHGDDNEALYWAVGCNHLEIVEIILSSATDKIELKHRLMCCSTKGHEKIVSRLLAAGADPSAESYYGSPLMAAAKNGHANVVALLLGAGANVHAQDDGALAVAAGAGHNDIVQMLLRVGWNESVLKEEAMAVLEGGHCQVVLDVLNRFASAGWRDGSHDGSLHD